MLRLLEFFPVSEVHAAVGNAVRSETTGFNAVKYPMMCMIEGRLPRLDLELYPHLSSGSVSTTPV